MTITSKFSGEIEINEKQILEFPEGLPGFEHLRQFALMDAQQPPFYWLQSMEVTEIAFALINPRIFRPSYDPGVSQAEMDALGVENPEDLLVFAIVTIPENQRDMTANLQGPLLINRKTRQGRQFISANPEWKVRHRVLDELAAVRSESC